MTYRRNTLSLAMLAFMALSQAQAQGLRLPNVPAPSPVATKLSTAQSDFIVAVVNSEPITNVEVQRETQREYQQLVQQDRAPTDAQVLAPEVLEGLINRKVQLQLARETGLRVEESAIDQAEQSIAAQNQLDVAELHRRVQQGGQSVSEFRSQLSDQILLQRLRERDVDSHVRVSEQDIDQFLHDQQTVMTSGDVEINLAQILVAVPESASPQQVEALKLRAQRALDRARKGEDFAALVKEFSDASDLANGGQLGLRSSNRYPELFVQATRALGVGDVADLVRSAAGFHVLKVIEKVRPDLPTMAVTQSHVRHILLVPGANLSEAEAVRKLADFKKQVMSNRADFAALAREYSKDGSAAQGGDLGWASPGMFVPEFEAAMNRLAPGELSDPLVSRFGVHLIQLLERRKVTLTPEQQREAVRNVLREKKSQEAYRTWAQDVRARAYVEMREPPQK
jgi:peptidyl-prolyl cis-trans isomerase SurA